MYGEDFGFSSSGRIGSVGISRGVTPIPPVTPWAFPASKFHFTSSVAPWESTLVATMNPPPYAAGAFYSVFHFPFRYLLYVLRWAFCFS